MYTHVNTAPSEEVFLLDISFLRAKREKKIKAMERDVIFFPRIFERPPVREIYGDRKKERKKGRERERERRVRKNHPTFFSRREEFIMVQLPPSCRISFLLLFPPLRLPLPLHHLLFFHLVFTWLLIRYLYSKRYICRAKNSN